MNILLGIQFTPGKPGELPQASVFYCGRDGVQFRKKHAELVAANKDGSRFFQIANPILTPLQNIPNSTEDHPDHVAAQKRREELAAKAPAKAGTHSEPKSFLHAKVRRNELNAFKVKELQALVERIKACGQDIDAAGGTKAELINAILKSEGITVPEEPAPAE